MHVDPHELGTAEQQLRYAKSSIAALNRLLSNAEKGGVAHYDELKEKMDDARAVLVELSHCRVSTSRAGGGGGVSTAPIWKGSTVHARAVGQHAVTDIQCRTAQQLLVELNLIDTSLQRCCRKAQQRQTHVSEVEQLTGMMTNKGGSDDVSSLQHLEGERTSLQYTRNRVRAMLEESSLVMKALQDQGGRLEKTDSKVADVLESLGVANSTLLQILRRNKVDAWLVYGGIALTLLFIYYIW